MFKTLTTIVASNILLDFLIHAIIVERNLHAYYRLPTTTVKMSNESEDYYILQCPYKSSLNIPKPKDMPVCLIVSRYSVNEDKRRELVKAKPCTTLNTQVDYRHLKPPVKLVKLVKIKNGKPYTLLLKPVDKQENKYKRSKPETTEQYKATNIKIVEPNSKMPINKTTVGFNVPLIQKTNDSLALSSIKETKKLILKPQTALSFEENFPDDPLDEEDTETGPLKYLGVQDTLKELQQLPHPLTANQTLYKSEKFFADLDKYKKGFRSKGFQNMYHRDEIYQDHIFYDDLQQMGNYHINQKSQQKPQ